MQAEQLQSLMVINKSQQLHWTLKIKTLIIDISTWLLWFYVAYFIYKHFDTMLNLPIIENYLYIEVLSMMMGIVAGLLIITVGWAIVAKNHNLELIIPLQRLEELEIENNRLRMENEYLKQLNRNIS